MTVSLDEILEFKSKEELRDIMYEALDLMQQYNGRSRIWCIVVALGGTASDNDDGSFTYSIPTSSDTKCCNHQT